MKVLINNQELACSVGEENKRIDEFLQSQGLFITGIAVNGISVDMELNEALELEGLEKIEIDASTVNELIESNINNTLAYIPKLGLSLKAAAELFQQGNESQAIEIFIQATDGLGWVINIINLLEQNYPGCDYEPLKVQYSANLKDIFDQLLEAWENKDYILIGDLISYELVPVLENVLDSVEEMGSKIHQPKRA